MACVLLSCGRGRNRRLRADQIVAHRRRCSPCVASAIGKLPPAQNDAQGHAHDHCDDARRRQAGDTCLFASRQGALASNSGTRSLFPDEVCHLRYLRPLRLRVRASGCSRPLRLARRMVSAGQRTQRRNRYPEMAARPALAKREDRNVGLILSRVVRVGRRRSISHPR